MLTDRRLLGVTRYRVAEPRDWRMRIPDDVLSCPVFLGFNRTPGDISTVKYAGTGFLVTIVEDGHGFTYLVTVHHVASKIRNEAEPIAWLRSESGDPYFVTLTEATWYYPDDPSVDIAACRFFPPIKSKVLGVHPAMFMLARHFNPNGVGVGDEVFSVSLFGFRGKLFTNTPIVRVGNIAMLPNDKIPTNTPYGDMEAYLVEARSIGGMSGAPVFARETVMVNTPGVDTDGNPVTLSLQTQGSFGLLGIVHGHWDVLPGDLNNVFPTVDTKDGVNVGIAIVVPSQKIIDLLSSEEVRNPRLEAVERKKREHANETAVTMDCVTDDG